MPNDSVSAGTTLPTSQVLKKPAFVLSKNYQNLLFLAEPPYTGNFTLLPTPDIHKKVFFFFFLFLFCIFTFFFRMLFSSQNYRCLKEAKENPNEFLCRKEICTCLIKCLSEGGCTPLFLNYYQSTEYTIYS